MSDFKLTMKTAAEAIETGELIRRAAKLAPAHGLTLEEVGYPADEELAAQSERARAKREL